VGLRTGVLPAVVAGLTLLLATGCGGTAVPAPAPAASAAAPVTLTPAPGRQTLAETGSTLLLPLVGAWATAYHQQHPGVTVTVAGTGSATGIADASDGKASIGASDAYLSSGSLVQNPSLVNVPLVISAQQVNYNLPSLSPAVHIRLDGPVLAAMYSGQITSWDDSSIQNLNPGVRLPATKVVPFHRSDGSGDTFLFTSYVSTHDAAWNSAIGYGTSVAWPAAPRAEAEKGNASMVSGCSVTPGCVAYVGISYLGTALNAGLGEAELANTLGQYELPDQASIQAAVASFVSSTPPSETISMIDGPAPGGYPIVNYEYAIVSTHQPSAARARDIRAFLHWAITTGNSAQFLGGVRFQPLPAAVVSLSDAQIAKIG
jgi:phosphate transport system substrate-binding protein